MQGNAYYGEETKKAVENFGTEYLPYELIRSMGEVKKACLKAIQEYENRFSEKEYESIISAIDKIIDGSLNDQFVVPLKQGGAGTSLNMNFNEVIASLSSTNLKENHNIDKKIDYLDDINRYQSTNDVFPTAVTIAILRKLIETENNIIILQELLVSKESEYDHILMVGRTEMQDALPIKLGQIFAGWAGMIERDRWRFTKLRERIRNIPLGGTAIGTCFFAPQKYIYLAERNIREITNLPVCRSQNLTDEVSNTDKYSELANGIKIVAENLYKITGDFLLYTSSFINEINHPELQYGSSIMAAKTNPVILEYVRGLSIDIQFECNKISAFCQNGQLQLNAYLPFILNSLLLSFNMLNKAITTFKDKFLQHMKINYSKIEKNLVHSYALLNALIPVLGYHKIKELYQIIENEKISNLDGIKKVIVENSKITNDEIDKLFEISNLTGFTKW